MAKGPSKARESRVNIAISDRLRGGAEPELPFRLLVMGDYTQKDDKRPIEERVPLDINKSNFDSVMQSHNLSLDTSVPDRISGEGEMSVSLKFGTLKDFRPESVAKQVPQLNKLLELRDAIKALRPKMGDKAAQQELLRMARESIERYVTTGEIPSFEPTWDVLKEKRGVFVTLREHGQLRGCIGHHESDVPLYQLVPQMAVAAACRDRRFYPLGKNELDQVKIKLSVYLTNVYRIQHLDEFEMGVHGIILMKGRKGATYLPEVPLEAGWISKEEEMGHLCAKAGLPPEAWREGAELYVYRTQVFGEE